METKKEFDLLALGELLLRLSPPNNERIVRGETLQKQAGGAELNVVSGVSLLGLRTGIISKLPANDIGTYIKNRVRFCGVSDDYLVYDSEKDARLGVYYYENGAYPRKPGIVYDRMYTSMTKIDVEDFDESLFSSARCFHTTGITLALSEKTRETAIEMIKRFKQAGAMISFDVNFRGNLWTGEEARACIERILPYVDRYYLFINDERVDTDIRDPKVKQVIYEFYKQHHPEYLKENLPDDMTDVDILDCFEVFKMPDYRPKHAFPGLVTLEDIRNGNIHDEDKPKFAFPGLELYSNRDASEDEEEKPMVASYKGYTAFDGDREQAKDKIEQLKSQFASQIEALNVDEILKNRSENQEE